jgi:Ca2+-transporting ATPase
MVSLTVGIYEDIHTIEYDSFGNKVPGVKWVEGVAIIIAVVLVVIVGSVNDFQKERQFRSLNAKKDDRQVSVSKLIIFNYYQAKKKYAWLGYSFW